MTRCQAWVHFAAALYAHPEATAKGSAKAADDMLAEYDRRIAALDTGGVVGDLLSALKDVLKHGGESSDEWIDIKYYRAAEKAIARAEAK